MKPQHYANTVSYCTHKSILYVSWVAAALYDQLRQHAEVCYLVNTD